MSIHHYPTQSLKKFSSGDPGARATVHRPLPVLAPCPSVNLPRSHPPLMTNLIRLVPSTSHTRTKLRTKSGTAEPCLPPSRRSTSLVASAKHLQRPCKSFTILGWHRKMRRRMRKKSGVEADGVAEEKGPIHLMRQRTIVTPIVIQSLETDSHTGVLPDSGLCVACVSACVLRSIRKSSRPLYGPSLA